jgi:hypothetical protein
MSKIEVATGREKGTLAAITAAASQSQDGDRLEGLSGSGSTAAEGSGHPQVTTKRLEDAAPQTTG